ncbi:hypothetical protein GW17_00062456 [Ensete ventricosum]|nr:hypothetical protein GW17_00062456 [Ensete ventricosum]
MSRPSIGVAGQGQAACRGGGLPPRSPARGLSATARAAYKSGWPWQARNQAATSLQQRLPHARAVTRRSARRDDAHGGATYDRGTGRKGNSARPLARRLPAGKGNRRLYRGGDDGAMRVKEEG